MGRYQLHIIPMTIEYLPFVAHWTEDIPSDVIKSRLENTTFDNDQILCLMDRIVPVAYLDIYSKKFTELHVPYKPGEHAWSCRLTLDPLINKNVELQTDIMEAFEAYVAKEKQATEMLWELAQSELRLQAIAQQSGFSKAGNTEKFVLYHRALQSH